MSGIGGFTLRKTGLKERLLDLLLPNSCPFCFRVIEWDRYCCDECFGKCRMIFSADPARICPVCGKLMCICGEGRLYIDRCYSASFYDGLVRRGIYSLKYHRNENAAVIFTEILAERIINESGIKFDLITYVPMYRIKQSRRGYNQACVIAEKLSEKLGIPADGGYIEHLRSTVQQHERTRDERRAAVGGEYVPTGKAMKKGASVLLCDDVMTSGATIGRCAEILREKGAAYIAAAVCSETLT